MSAQWGRALSSIKTKAGPTAAAYNLTMGSRTSSRYRTPITEPRLKVCSSLQIWCPHHNASTSECVMFDDVLGLIAYSLFTPYPYTLLILLQSKS
ncbi:hypothetical protein TNCV_3442761 [Trichonephila clavipes]|nr:hypothetical protein TNCV_3442761 [Trichonephila clavipes]